MNRQLKVGDEVCRLALLGGLAMLAPLVALCGSLQVDFGKTTGPVKPVNGRPLEGFTIRHADIVRGGELVFEMTAGSSDDVKTERVLE